MRQKTQPPASVHRRGRAAISPSYAPNAKDGPTLWQVARVLHRYHQTLSAMATLELLRAPRAPLAGTDSSLSGCDGGDSSGFISLDLDLDMRGAAGPGPGPGFLSRSPSDSAEVEMLDSGARFAREFGRTSLHRSHMDQTCPR